MRAHAEGTIETLAWEENVYAESNGGPKLTRASVRASFSGDIEGEGTEEYLMAYPDDRFASFVGIEHFDGRVSGRSGSFVIQHSGTFESGKLKSNWFVVPGSGNGGLRGLRGEGTYVNEDGKPQTDYTFDYDFDLGENA